LLDDYFGPAIFVLPQHDVLAGFAAEYSGPLQFFIHGLQSPPAWLAVAGVVTAWYIVLVRPDMAEAAANLWPRFTKFLLNKYGFDDFNQKVFAAGSRGLGQFLWRYGDVMIIDDGLVNGSARAVSGLSERLRRIQSGYLYHYVFVMVIGMTALVGWLYWGFD
jgi:NADH-quinone oxidoreductase subunit L